VLGKLLERIPNTEQGYYELKKHKSWFEEGSSKLLETSKILVVTISGTNKW
jgi:hypothetical protein